MRVVFMGTPALAATVLEAIAGVHEVVGVVTRPDAVRGRGSKAIASPVKEAALRIEAPVFERTALGSAEDIRLIQSLAPDFICVAACGIILPQAVLDIPRLGCLNVHTSLLPRWRGAAPIERCILEGDDVTGVCIMRMEAGLDTGDYCKRVEVPVGNAYVDELTDALACIGAVQLLDAMADVEAGRAEWTPQAEIGLSYAAKIAKGELGIDVADSAPRAVAKVRASSAAHPARVAVAGRSLSVEKAAVVEDVQGRSACEGRAPGSAVFAAKRLFLVTASGAVELLSVRPDGKKSMDARSFASGIQGVKAMSLTWGRA